MHGQQLGVTAPKPTVQQATGDQAIRWMQQQYKMLTEAGAMLQQLTQARGKHLPCTLLDSYHRAVKEYLNSAQQIIDAFAQQGIVLRQVVYREGKPVENPNEPGGVKSIWLQAPLRPPTFVTRKICPQITHLSGGQPPLGAFGITPLGFLAILAVSGAAVLSLDKLRDAAIAWRSADPGAPGRFEAQKTCMESVRAALGYAPGQVLPRGVANKILAQCRIDPGGWSTLEIAGAVAVVGVVAGGAAWLYFRGLPTYRERKARRIEEREEAERLEREAEEKVKEAKRLRKGRGRTKKSVEAEYFPPEMVVAGSDKLGACPCAL